MTTEEAFKQLLTIKNMAKKLGIKDATFSAMKIEYIKGTRKVSLDKQIELLTNAGYEIVQPMQWVKSGCDVAFLNAVMKQVTKTKYEVTIGPLPEPKFYKE